MNFRLEFVYLTNVVSVKFGPLEEWEFILVLR